MGEESSEAWPLVGIYLQHLLSSNSGKSPARPCANVSAIKVHHLAGLFRTSIEQLK